MRCFDRCCEDFPDDAGDKSVALVGHYDFRIVIESVHEEIPLRLCFFKNLSAVFSGFQLDALFYDFVIFYKLYGCPSNVVRNGPFRKVFNEMIPVWKWNLRCPYCILLYAL